MRIQTQELNTQVNEVNTTEQDIQSNQKPWQHIRRRQEMNKKNQTKLNSHFSIPSTQNW